MEVKPNLGDLSWAKGTYATPFGPISVSAKRVGDEIVTEIDAPKEIEIVQ